MWTQTPSCSTSSRLIRGRTASDQARINEGSVQDKVPAEGLKCNVRERSVAGAPRRATLTFPVVAGAAIVVSGLPRRARVDERPRKLRHDKHPLQGIGCPMHLTRYLCAPHARGREYRRPRACRYTDFRISSSCRCQYDSDMCENDASVSRGVNVAARSRHGSGWCSGLRITVSNYSRIANQPAQYAVSTNRLPDFHS